METETLTREFWRISNDLREKGKFNDAITAYKKLLPEAERHHFLAPFQQIGVTYGLLKQYTEAEEWFTRTCELARAGEDHTTLGNTLRDHAIILNKQEKFAEALPLLEESITTLLKTTDLKGVITSIEKKGVSLSGLTRYTEAINHIEATRVVVRYMTDRDAEYFYYLFTYDLAAVLFKRGETERSLALAKESEEGCTRLGHTHRAEQAKALIDEIEHNLTSLQ